MLYEKIDLYEIYPELTANSEFRPSLTAYCPDNSSEIDMGRKRATVVICPGGGYAMTSDREAEPIALQFVAFGFNAFVLRYSVAPEIYPAALLQLSASVAFIRKNCDKFNADPNKISVCGFSAGGHLAASLGVYWHEPFIAEALKISDKSNMPNAMILCYPLITFGEFGHKDSLKNLLGSDASLDMIEKMSLENNVNNEVPPTFIWHTFNDSVVPVENTLNFAQSLRKNNVPFELHIYPQGVHGLSLCSYETANSETWIDPHCGTWLKLCDEWLKRVL